jgi:predicted signal transduction protein with EAL and GGDEF domain
LAARERHILHRKVDQVREDSKGCAVLRGLGCDFAQGYYISPPMPAEALPGWLNGSIAIRRLPESMLTKAEAEAIESSAA